MEGQGKFENTRILIYVQTPRIRSRVSGLSICAPCLPSGQFSSTADRNLLTSDHNRLFERSDGLWFHEVLDNAEVSGSLAGTLLAGKDRQLPGGECLVDSGGDHQQSPSCEHSSTAVARARSKAPPPVMTSGSGITTGPASRRRRPPENRGFNNTPHPAQRAKTLIRIEIPDDLEAKVRTNRSSRQRPALEAGVGTYVGTPLHRQVKITVVGSEPLAAAASGLTGNRRSAPKAGRWRTPEGWQVIAQSRQGRVSSENHTQHKVRSTDTIRERDLERFQFMCSGSRSA